MNKNYAGVNNLLIELYISSYMTATWIQMVNELIIRFLLISFKALCPNQYVTHFFGIDLLIIGLYPSDGATKDLFYINLEF